MTKGKPFNFSVEGSEKKTIIDIAAANPDKKSIPMRPHLRINVIGMEPQLVLEFIKGAMAYSIAKYGTLDASKWGDKDDTTITEVGEPGNKEGQV